MCVGVVIITVISIYQESFAQRFVTLPKSAERRLYFVCIQSLLMPIGLFWFGWTSYPSILWIVPTIAVGCATMGIFSVYLATFNYLADTYHRYASSAIAAQSCCRFSILLFCSSLLTRRSGRNLLGGVFPLVTNALFTNLGYPAASSLLGGIVSFCVYERGVEANLLTGSLAVYRPMGPSAVWTQDSRQEQICKCKCPQYIRLGPTNCTRNLHTSSL